MYCIVLYCIVLYCMMRPYTEGPIGPLSYRHSSGVVRNPHTTLADVYNNNNNNIFIHTCYNCIEQYIPINNNILRIIKHVMLNI